MKLFTITILILIHLFVLICFWKTNQMLDQALRRSSEDIVAMKKFFSVSDGTFNTEQRTKLLVEYLKRQSFRDECADEANSSFIFYFLMSLFITYVLLLLELQGRKKV